MGTLRRLSETELSRAIDRLLHPIPGGKVEAAKKFGVDVTLLIEQLRLTPAERARRMHALAQSVDSLRGKAVKRKS